MIYRRKFIVFEIEDLDLLGYKLSYINDEVYIHFSVRKSNFIRKLYKGSKNYYFQFRGNKILVPKEVVD